MVIATQRVADDHGVIARRVQAPVRFVTQGEAGQRLSVFERERGPMMKILRLDQPHLAGLGRQESGRIVRIVHGRGRVNHS
jgi:hypothetical protein